MKLSTHHFIGYIIAGLILLGMFPFTGQAQWVDPANGVIVEPSTSMTQLMNYGNNSVSHYTGTADVSIPIYTYEDYEFNIPIALKYAFTGQKPNDPTGPVGLGWVLNAGGCITRQIHGQADDSYTNDVWGFYSMFSSSESVPYFSDTRVTFDAQIKGLYYKMASKNIETEPDIFSFNFMGHTGKFIFWSNQQVIVFDTDQPKGMYRIEPIMDGINFYGFEIKTTDGYIYKFGCDKKLNVNDEMLYHQYFQGSDAATYNGPQVMWPLVSARAPSGRTVNFEYERASEFSKSVRPTSYLVEARPLYDDKWSHIAEMSIQQQKNISLKKISMERTFSVDFSYSANNWELSKNGYGSIDTIRLDGLLRSIFVYDGTNISPIRTVKFTRRSGHPNPVAILQRVEISDIGAYDLMYWEDDNGALYNCWTPYKGTCNIDHWGYSNCYTRDENDLIRNFFPSSTVKDNAETITSKQRDPIFKYALCGALRYIYYPTRGRTEFVYEKNEYSAAVVKSGLYQGNPNTEYYTNNREAGGIRIKKIIDCDYNPKYSLWTDTLRCRTYSYEYNGKSTGVLLKTPKYKTSQIREVTSGIDQYNFVASADLLDCIDADYHIEYQFVTETERDGSYSRYVYSTYAAPINGFSSAISDSGSPQYSTIAPIFNDMYVYFYMRPSSRKAWRGKLLSKTTYQAKQHPDDPDTPTYCEEYRYNMPSDYKTGLHTTRIYSYEYLIFTGCCSLASTVKTTYLEGKALSEGIHYQYGGETGYVTKIEKIDASGKTTLQQLYYDTFDGNPNKYTRLPSRSVLSVKQPGESDFKTTKIDKYVYMPYNVHPSWTTQRLREHWTTQFDNPKVYSSTADQDADLVLEAALLPNHSRILERTDRDGVTTTYLYGSDFSNLLAIVRNVSYNEVMSALKDTGSIGNYALSAAQETVLRSILKAQVTTYSYIPLTGLASVTSPTGSRQTYFYNASRRLSGVRGEAFNNPDSQMENTYKYQIHCLTE